jgi:osmoprotectant transport system permease protein
MDARVAEAFALMPGYLAGHVALSASALTLGTAISLPLAVWAARSPKVRWPALAFAGLIQTIPSLALLALFYPLMLAVSVLTKTLFGLALPALGFLPSLLALTLYSMLPILRNGVAGLIGIDPAVIEAADGVGMTRAQRLWRVEAPLAAPVAMAGVRTAAALTIGTATLATPVGQTTLGNYIFSGLQTENWVFVLFGCAAAAALALVVDLLLGLIETGAARRDRRRILIGTAALLAGTAAALSPLVAEPVPRYVIGAKNFSEQFILASVITDRLQAKGARPAEKDGLGSAVIFAGGRGPRRLCRLLRHPVDQRPWTDRHAAAGAAAGRTHPRVGQAVRGDGARLVGLRERLRPGDEGRSRRGVGGERHRRPDAPSPRADPGRRHRIPQPARVGQGARRL